MSCFASRMINNHIMHAKRQRLTTQTPESSTTGRRQMIILKVTRSQGQSRDYSSRDHRKYQHREPNKCSETQNGMKESQLICLFFFVFFACLFFLERETTNLFSGPAREEWKEIRDKMEDERKCKGLKKNLDRLVKPFFTNYMK